MIVDTLSKKNKGLYHMEGCHSCNKSLTSRLDFFLNHSLTLCLVHNHAPE